MPAKYTPEQHLKAFWSRVDRSGGDEACWNWTAHQTPQGYGRTHWNNKTEQAHRVSYLIEHGELSNDLYVLHRCDNPSCVNPRHLFVGTALDNARDREEKGRHADINGEKHPRHKITSVDVKRAMYFRERYGLPYSYIGKIIGISRQMVGHIIRGENWTAA